jgi:translation initiation factor IF-3
MFLFYIEVLFINNVDKLIRVNEQIRSTKVMLINKEGKQLGILDTDKALEIARIEQLDLVEINAKYDPPVVKIMDYKKFLFNKSKGNSALNKRKDKLKEIKFKITTSKNDYDMKVRSVLGFLKEGRRVRVTVFFRGREITYKEAGVRILSDVVNVVNMVGFLRDNPKLEGRQLVAIIEPL